MKFKKFLEENVQFNFSIMYKAEDGKTKLFNTKASIQNQAILKFKSSDATKGYKEIVSVTKGDVATE